MMRRTSALLHAAQLAVTLWLAVAAGIICASAVPTAEQQRLTDIMYWNCLEDWFSDLVC
jgi:hypothetical protein